MQAFLQDNIRVTYNPEDCGAVYEGWVRIETVEEDGQDLWLTRKQYDTMRRIFEQSGKIGN